MSRSIDIEPISGALGAEISGIDLTQDLTADAFKAVKQAFLDYHVIFFRDQDRLTPKQQKAFGHCSVR